MTSCTGCGCTDLDACVDDAGRPCAWATPTLCTACVPSEPPC